VSDVSDFLSWSTSTSESAGPRESPKELEHVGSLRVRCARSLDPDMAVGGGEPNTGPTRGSLKATGPQGLPRGSLKAYHREEM